MNFKHKSDCSGVALQLQKREWNAHNGSRKTEFRVNCVGCGASVNVTDELARKWNELGSGIPLKRLQRLGVL
jgi:hypothetical protein